MKLLNSASERFMEKYFPITKEIGTGRREDVGLSIVSEGLQGNNTGDHIKESAGQTKEEIK